VRGTGSGAIAMSELRRGLNVLYGVVTAPELEEDLA
jgi:hypothetical protein